MGKKAAEMRGLSTMSPNEQTIKLVSDNTPMPTMVESIWHRRLAMQIVTQLPDEIADAQMVLRCAERLVADYLEKGG